MTRTLFVVSVILVNSWISTASLNACGDKIASVAKGGRWERAPVGKQESILIYTNPASDVPKALAHVEADGALRGAGFRPTVIVGPTDFDAKLKQGGWDLVVVGINDAPAAARSANRVLPVALGTSKAALADIGKTYPVVLTKAPNSEGLVQAIVDALGARVTRQRR